MAKETSDDDPILARIGSAWLVGPLAVAGGTSLVMGALSPWLRSGGPGFPLVREQSGVDLGFGAPLVPLGVLAVVVGGLLLIGRWPGRLLAGTAIFAGSLAAFGFNRVTRPRLSDVPLEVLRSTDVLYSRPAFGLWFDEPKNEHQAGAEGNRERWAPSL